MKLSNSSILGIIGYSRIMKTLPSIVMALRVILAVNVVYHVSCNDRKLNKESGSYDHNINTTRTLQQNNNNLLNMLATYFTANLTSSQYRLGERSSTGFSSDFPSVAKPDGSRDSRQLSTMKLTDGNSASGSKKTKTLFSRQHLQYRILLQVASYLRSDELVLVMQEEERERCVFLGRPLYMNHIRTTCISLAKITGYHPAIIFIGNTKDNGSRISEALQDLGTKVALGEVTVTHIVIVLFSPIIELRSPQQTMMRYCVVRVKDEGVEFQEVFTFGPGSSLPAEEVVAWWHPNVKSSNFKMPYRDDVIAPTNFMGNIVRVAYVESSPEIIRIPTADGSLKLTGYMADIVYILQKQLNFTVHWVNPPDKQFGIPLPNGTFTGIVGLLQRKEADLGAAGLGASIPRSKVMDFSPPVDFGGYGLYIHWDPGVQDISWKTYVQGFQWKVWVTLAVYLTLMALGLCIVTGGETRTSISTYLFIFIGILAQQGSHSEPQSVKGRTVFLCYWIGSVVLYASYTATLTSQLTVVHTRAPFSSLYEALSKSGYSVVVRDGAGVISSVKEMRHKNKGLKLMYDQWMEGEDLFVADDNEAVTRIESDEKLAYIRYTKEISPRMHGNCSFVSVGENYFMGYVHIGLMKDLTYGKMISYSITRMVTSGILQKLQKKWWGSDFTCIHTGVPHLGFSKTLTAFILLGGGMLLSVSILLVEKMYFSWYLNVDHSNRHVSDVSNGGEVKKSNNSYGTSSRKSDDFKLRVNIQLYQ